MIRGVKTLSATTRCPIYRNGVQNRNRNAIWSGRGSFTAVPCPKVDDGFVGNAPEPKLAFNVRLFRLVVQRILDKLEGAGRPDLLTFVDRVENQ